MATRDRYAEDHGHALAVVKMRQGKTVIDGVVLPVAERGTEWIGRVVQQDTRLESVGYMEITATVRFYLVSRARVPK